ncbi:MAG: baseplate J/gp47 family protein, partial [Oscillospiraceae bacterium]
MDFNEIYEKMRKDYEEKANCIISDASDSAIKLKTVAGQIFKLYEKLDFVEKQAFLDTATGEYLKKHGETRGIFPKSATSSSGEVTFFKTANNTSTINIPCGTLCACSNDGNLLYKVTKNTIIPADKTSAICNVISVSTGNKSGVAPTFVDTLVSPIFGIERISNLAKIDGGG